MKRVLFFGIGILGALTLIGCGGSKTVAIDGKEAIIDSRENAVICGDDIYQYSFGATKGSVTIYYPDGYVYEQQMDKDGMGTGSGGYRDSKMSISDHREQDYLDKSELIRVITKMDSGFSSEPWKIFAGIFLIGVGALIALFPKVSWYLRYWWQLRDGRPEDASTAAIVLERLSGAVLAILGVVLLVGFI